MIRRYSLLTLLFLVAAYLALELPLPVVLLGHESGLLTGNPDHTTLDDHAWLDHAAGSGVMSVEGGIVAVDHVGSLILPIKSYDESFRMQFPSLRGPPLCRVY